VRTHVLMPAGSRTRAALFAIVAAALAAAPLAAVQAARDGGVAGLHTRTATAQATRGFVVIVHEDNDQAGIQLDLLSKIFLKKVQKWPTGPVIATVDQPSSAAVRERFTKSVHRRSIAAVNAYWQQRIFSGHQLPPAELDGDAAVIAFVRGNPDAIGYVAAGTPLPAGVKILRIES